MELKMLLKRKGFSACLTCHVAQMESLILNTVSQRLFFLVCFLVPPEDWEKENKRKWKSCCGRKNDTKEFSIEHLELSTLTVSSQLQELIF